jgi:hypothetical protein
MNPWAVREYVTEEGQNLIRLWYAKQGQEARAEIDVGVAVLRQTPDWLDPELELFKVLVGKHQGLSQIRINFGVRPPGTKKQTVRRIRILGVYRPEAREFLMILGCEKFGMNTTPPNAFDDALRYRNEWSLGRGWTHEHY